jgi:glycosyltransferase involved in cell wall biosynthesis
VIQAGDEAVRRGVCAFLSELDAEFALLSSGQVEPGAHVDRILRRMIAPPFLTDVAANSDRAQPVVSVVLPTRDRAIPIVEAIASVQGQSFANWELIVVDDGSRDRTAEAVAPFLIDRRIRYVAQEPRGHCAARNRALELSRGALTAYLDSDNLWYPNFLAAAVAVLDAFPETDCVYGALVTQAHNESAGALLFEDFNRDRLLERNYIDLNTVVHRSKLVKVHGGFDEALTRLVDWDLLLRFTRDKPARRAPVLAAQYRALDDQRVTLTQPLEPNYDAIRRKWPNVVLSPSSPSAAR